jgi:hypothetical protein
VNTDELATQLRKDVPDLEFPPPDCAFCGTETDTVDDYFDCPICQLSWDHNGRFVGPINEDKPRCGVEVKPWADKPGYEAIAEHVYRCVLDEGHAEDDNPRMTHRGYRVDGYGTTFAWPVAR